MRQLLPAHETQIESTQSDFYSKFKDRIRRNLHVVLAFSPTGEAFRDHLRHYTSLVNCCTIDWFQVKYCTLWSYACILIMFDNVLPSKMNATWPIMALQPQWPQVIASEYVTSLAKTCGRWCSPGGVSSAAWHAASWKHIQINNWQLLFREWAQLQSLHYASPLDFRHIYMPYVRKLLMHGFRPHQGL